MKFLLLTAGIVLGLAANAQETDSIVAPLNEQYIPEFRMEQYNEYLSGETAFSPWYRHRFEVGVSTGMMRIGGDVRSEMGYGWGADIRKGIGYFFSLRLGYTGGVAYGLDWAPSSAISFNPALNGAQGPDYTEDGFVYHNYKTTMHSVNLEGMFNFNNLLFHKEKNVVSPYLVFGAGVLTYNTKVDQLNEDGLEYDYNAIPHRSSDIEHKDAQRDALQGALDGTYETDAEAPQSNYKLSDKYAMFLQGTAGAGVDFKITPRLSVGLEHKIGFQNTDLLDGNRWDNPSQDGGNPLPSRNQDYTHYTSVRMNFNFRKNAEQPEWWINPLANTYNNIRDLNEKTDYEADEDNDGVHDAYDLEPGTEEGAVVDVRGRTVDSDKDGFPDHKDPEPYSTPVFEIDETGVNVYPFASKEDVEQVLQNTNTGSWFLPSVYFDLAKWVIRPEDAERFEQVAYVLEQNDNMKIEAIGYADTRGSDASNLKLSQNRVEAAISFISERYGIDRSRFVIKYKGETDLLIPDAEKESEHQMNRRVQFRVVK